MVSKSILKRIKNKFPRHCEKQGDEAIPKEIAALLAVARNDDSL